LCILSSVFCAALRVKLPSKELEALKVKVFLSVVPPETVNP
jgi:hypothetical protein